MNPLAGLHAQVDIGGGDAGPAMSDAHTGAVLAAAIGAIIVAIFVGRGRGLVGGTVAVVGFVVLVVAAQLPAGYLLHSWTLNHPDNKLAFGVSYDLSGV